MLPPSFLIVSATLAPSAETSVRQSPALPKLGHIALRALGVHVRILLRVLPCIFVPRPKEKSVSQALHNSFHPHIIPPSDTETQKRKGEKQEKRKKTQLTAQHHYSAIPRPFSPPPPQTPIPPSTPSPTRHTPSVQSPGARPRAPARTVAACPRAIPGPFGRSTTLRVP